MIPFFRDMAVAEDDLDDAARLERIAEAANLSPDEARRRYAPL